MKSLSLPVFPNNLCFRTHTFISEKSANAYTKISAGRVKAEDSVQYIRARTGVIVCAGGFSTNAKLCGLHDPHLENPGTTNHPGATGEV